MKPGLFKKSNMHWMQKPRAAGSHKNPPTSIAITQANVIAWNEAGRAFMNATDAQIFVRRSKKKAGDKFGFMIRQLHFDKWRISVVSAKIASTVATSFGVFIVAKAHLGLIATKPHIQSAPHNINRWVADFLGSKAPMCR
jgi:hypothetical protein